MVLYTPLFTGVALCALAGMACGALMAFASFPLEEAALVIADACAALGAFVPSVAFKLAGMRMPFLPNNPQHLQENIEPYPERERQCPSSSPVSRRSWGGPVSTPHRAGTASPWAGLPRRAEHGSWHCRPPT